MSEPIILSREEPGQQYIIHPGFIDLNATVKNALTQEGGSLATIHALVRHDELPLVKADEADMNQLFANLVRLVLLNPPAEGKLFIYFRCVEKDPASDDKTVTVSVHTNTSCDVTRDKSQAALLHECGALCKKNNGDFIYHLVSNTSCLFTINLQGK